MKTGLYSNVGVARLYLLWDCSFTFQNDDYIQGYFLLHKDLSITLIPTTPYEEKLDFLMDSSENLPTAVWYRHASPPLKLIGQTTTASDIGRRIKAKCYFVI